VDGALKTDPSTLRGCGSLEESLYDRDVTKAAAGPTIEPLEVVDPVPHWSLGLVGAMKTLEMFGIRDEDVVIIHFH